MTVRISSLRSDASLDVSGYARGAAQKTDADARMIAADKAFTASQRQIALALVATGQRLGNYSNALTESDKALARISSNTDDASRSFMESGITAARVANHMKTAAVAAYALSPAFRQLVNPALVTSMRLLGPAAVAAGGAALSALSPVLATVGRLALPIGVAVESFRAMNAISDLGAAKLEEFNNLAAKAGGAGVSTDVFQRHAIGAKKFGIEADLATKAVENFNTASREQLGGSAFDQRMDQLTKAGNFQGNPGVAALQQATDTVSRYRAVGDLITLAADRGERLAALDLASKFLPPELLKRLQASGTTLKELQITADNIKAVDIVDPAEIGYALDLKRRLDDANEVIANKFKPVQKDLTQLGLNYQESWVNITEVMAGAVIKGNDLYSALKGIPGLLAQAGNASFWTKLTDYTGKLGLNSDPKSLGLILPNDPNFNVDPARAALAAQLRNPNAIQQAQLQATTIQSAVRGDVSINPMNAAGARPDGKDKVDAAINNLRRHTEQQIADTNAMGLGVAALARFRAEAAMTSVVQANGGKITADQAAQFQVLITQATNAALALEKARIASGIEFSRQTSLLSPEDVAIAQQLKGIYPDVADALSSVQAAGLRTNAALGNLSSSMSGTLTTGMADIVDGTKSISLGAGDMSKAFIRAIEEMIIKIAVVTPLMRALQMAANSFGSILGGGSSVSAGQSVSGTGLSSTTTGGLYANGDVFGNVIPFARGSAFANGIYSSPTLFRFANGAGISNGVMGEAGPEAVMPLRRGSDGRLGVAMTGSGGNGAGAGGGIAVNVFNAPAGTSAKVDQYQNPNGSMSIDITLKKMVEGIVSESIASGDVGRTISSKFGVKSFAGS